MGRSQRILIVEDEPNVRLVLQTALESEGYVLATAEDGEAALEQLRSGPADLVLLDLRMPRLDGLGVLKRMRDAGLDTPVVILSAHDRAPNVVQAMKLGAIDFLSKPLTPESLRRVVSEVLARPGRATRPVPAAKKAGGASASPAAECLARAKQALTRRAFDHAEAELRKAIANDARCAEAHYLLGVLHLLRLSGRSAGRPELRTGQAPPDEVLQRPHALKLDP